jgi:hypothetical protein
MKLLRLKGCPKCKGALFAGEDTYGKYLTCTSCGWSKDLAVGKPLPPAKEDAEADREGLMDGCNISSSCFTCPLMDCAWETPSTRHAYLWDKAATQLFLQYQALGTAKAVSLAAKELKVSERSVYRALKRQAQRKERKWMEGRSKRHGIGVAEARWKESERIHQAFVP